MSSNGRRIPGFPSGTSGWKFANCVGVFSGLTIPDIIPGI